MHEFHRKRCDAGYSSLPFEKDRYPQPDWNEVLKQGLGTMYHNWVPADDFIKDGCQGDFKKAW